MPGKTASPPHSAADMIVATPPEDVRDVIPLPGYRLAVRFYDGVSGIVDMSARLRNRSIGVFAALRDPAVFNAVRVEMGTVSWPSGADLAPDVMHDALATHGEWRLS